jgi:hypothetical protein
MSFAASAYDDALDGRRGQFDEAQYYVAFDVAMCTALRRAARKPECTAAAHKSTAVHVQETVDLVSSGYVVSAAGSASSARYVSVAMQDDELFVQATRRSGGMYTILNEASAHYSEPDAAPWNH